VAEMEELLKLLARKRLHPEETVTHRFTLGEAAYRLFDQGRPRRWCSRRRSCAKDRHAEREGRARVRFGT
jgi:hypothetical protein